MSTASVPHPEGKKKERVVVVLPAELARRLREVARQTGVPMSLIVSLTLGSALDNMKTVPPYTRAKVKKKA